MSDPQGRFRLPEGYPGPPLNPIHITFAPNEHRQTTTHRQHETTNGQEQTVIYEIDAGIRDHLTWSAVFRNGVSLTLCRVNYAYLSLAPYISALSFQVHGYLSGLCIPREQNLTPQKDPSNVHSLIATFC